jgi:hypothetical protein
MKLRAQPRCATRAENGENAIGFRAAANFLQRSPDSGGFLEVNSEETNNNDSKSHRILTFPQRYRDLSARRGTLDRLRSPLLSPTFLCWSLCRLSKYAHFISLMRPAVVLRKILNRCHLLLSLHRETVASSRLSCDLTKSNFALSPEV